MDPVPPEKSHRRGRFVEPLISLRMLLLTPFPAIIPNVLNAAAPPLTTA
jgi:hypothetical protein